jgi:hypothetical protein
LRRREPAIDERLQDLPQKIGDEEDHDGAERAAHEPRQQRVAAGELHDVDLPKAGEEQRRREDQDGAQAALDIDGRKARGARRDPSSSGREEMRGGAVHDREGDRQHERDDRHPEQPPETQHPHQPDQDEVDGQEPVERLAPAMPGLARRSGREPRPAPERLDRDEEEPEAEREGDEALGVIGEAERVERVAARPAEGEPGGEGADAQMPERGCLLRHRHEAIARDVVGAKARLEQEPRHEERHARGERRDEIGEHDRLEDRRPVERQEGADAAGGEDQYRGKTEAEADGRRPQAVRDGVEGRVLGPQARGVRRAPERPLGPGAEKAEAEHEGEDAERAAVLELPAENGAGVPQLLRQLRDRGAETVETRPRQRQALGRKARKRALGGALSFRRRPSSAPRRASCAPPARREASTARAPAPAARAARAPAPMPACRRAGTSPKGRR